MVSFQGFRLEGVQATYITCDDLVLFFNCFLEKAFDLSSVVREEISVFVGNQPCPVSIVSVDTIPNSVSIISPLIKYIACCL